MLKMDIAEKLVAILLVAVIVAVVVFV